MSAPTNPARMWLTCAVDSLGDVAAEGYERKDIAADRLAQCRSAGGVARFGDLAEYIRADVAAQEREAAVAAYRHKLRVLKDRYARGDIPLAAEAMGRAIEVLDDVLGKKVNHDDE